MKDSRKSKPCPECGKSAPRWIPKEVAGTFNVETSGMTPQNTGVHQVDTNWDRVIGKDSARRWNREAARWKDKAAFARSQGAHMKDLSENPDGTYRVLKPEEQQIHQRALDINKKAMDGLYPRKESSK